MKFKANSYSRIKVSVLFGTYDIENPEVGLKATLDALEKIPKVTRNNLKKMKFRDKVEKYVENPGIRRSLFQSNQVS